MQRQDQHNGSANQIDLIWRQQQQASDVLSSTHANMVRKSSILTLIPTAKRLLLLIFICNQLSPLLCVLSPETSPAAAAAQEDGEASKQARQLVEKPASINLKTILKHQTALEAECAKYHEEKVSQIKFIHNFLDDYSAEVGLPRLLPVKVPAVCLFLFSSEQAAVSSKSASSNKLDLVNWIYDLDDAKFATTTNNGNKDSNITKRQVGSPFDSSLLSNYLYDTSNIGGASSEEEENELLPMNVERKKVHQHLGNMMADDRFRRTIDNNRAEIAPYLSPVILVPGLLGSRLQARTNKQSGVNILCSKKSDWKDVWLSVRLLLPVVIDCWLDNVRLEYDPSTGFTKPPVGVETRVANFGSVESVRNLDLKSPKLGAYFSAIIDQYERLGYKADENLLAAPYDFRLAPQELGAYFADLKQLIERALRQQSPSPLDGKRKKVTLICHSMGCTHLLVFLRQQSASWRQSRIRKLIALSSPWAGAIKALKALVVGDSLELPSLSEVKMRAIARTYPSIAFLLPQAEVFGRPNKDRVEAGGPMLVQTPARQYRANQMDALLRDLNLTKQLEWFEATASLIKPLDPLPDLHVDCIHGLNAPTPETLIFREESSFPDGEYELISGDGDGTVNSESLMVCQDWAKKLPDKVKHKIIMNTNHVGVLTSKKTLAHIMDDVMID